MGNGVNYFIKLEYLRRWANFVIEINNSASILSILELRRL